MSPNKHSIALHISIIHLNKYITHKQESSNKYNFMRINKKIFINNSVDSILNLWWKKKIIYDDGWWWSGLTFNNAFKSNSIGKLYIDTQRHAAKYSALHEYHVIHNMSICVCVCMYPIQKLGELRYFNSIVLKMNSIHLFLVFSFYKWCTQISCK